jgi:hypothetical protein
MTPADLETYTRQRYNAVGDTFFPSAEIMNFFYQGQIELAVETKCIQSTYTTTSVDGQRAYDFPSYTIGIKRIEYDGARIRPSDFIEDDVLTGNSPDTTSEGVPEFYQIWGSQIYLRPVPNASSETIKVYSYDMPAVPTSNGALSVPSYAHIYLADYALYCMTMQDKNFALADRFLQKWENDKEQVKKIERSRMVDDSFRVVKDENALCDTSGI